MKIGVVGTFIRDRILPWKGAETDSIGGLFFTVSYLANLVEKDTEIVPVCFLGADFFDDVMACLSRYQNVCLDGLRMLNRENTRVELRYTGPQERIETTTQPMPAIAFEQLELLVDADAVIVNLITGVDVAIEALQALRRASSATLYLDFHSRALGIDEKGQRFYKRPDDWQLWVREVDILQLNENEAETLAELPPCSNAENLLAFARSMVALGPKICHLTLAENGSCLAYREGGEIISRTVQGTSVEEVVDIIGCGDAFEAAFMAKYVLGADILDATRYAHKVAAANCGFIGSSGIDGIRRLMEESVWSQ